MAEVIIPGPEGRLEGRYHQSSIKRAPAAVVLHPHPQHGGTMNNKVAYNLYHQFANAGYSVLRFNFRGVGRSQGKYDEGVGELADAAAALDWLQNETPDAGSYWVSGFSFGAWIAMQLLMRRPEIEGFVSISPPAHKYDFSFLSPCPSPGLIVQGDADSVVDEEYVAKLVDKLVKQRRNGDSDIEYHVIAGADHFFRERMNEMNKTILEYLLSKQEDSPKEKPVKRDRRRRQLPVV
ncbi:MAG: alpha/beta hydrolase [Alphaproteobacteria bacterium]|nr:alpha/beta hydrolase [Alphaproteobacteria bacterium]